MNLVPFTFARARFQSAVLAYIEPLPHPTVIAPPRVILPFCNTRTRSILFVLITRSCASMVPRKLDTDVVPELPNVAHGVSHPLAPASACQLARPVASDTSTFPAHGDPPVIFT